MKLQKNLHSHTIHVRIVHEPDDLIREQFRIVLAVQVRLRRLRRVELQALPDALTQHMASRVRLHDLGHSLLHQNLESREVHAVSRVQVVGEIDTDHQTCSGRVDAGTVGRVVKVLGARVSFNIVGIVVAIPQLHINPEFVARRAIQNIFALIGGNVSNGYYGISRKLTSVTNEGRAMFHL